MGIWYCVANYSKKEYLTSGEQTSKMPGILNRVHYLPRILFLKLMYEWAGDDISIVGDVGWRPWDHDNSGWTDVTKESITNALNSYGKYFLDEKSDA